MFGIEGMIPETSTVSLKFKYRQIQILINFFSRRFLLKINYHFPLTYLGQAADVCFPPEGNRKNQTKICITNSIYFLKFKPGVELKQSRESNMSGQLFGVASRVGRRRQFSSSKMSWLEEIYCLAQ